MLRGKRLHNPEKKILKDLAMMIKTWRDNTVDCDIILMADMNEFMGDKQDVYAFC